MTRTDVQQLYARFGGRWWEPFRAGWEFLTCRQAINDLESLLRRYARAGTSVLDVGCGTGVNLARLLRLGVPFADYTGLDFSPSMLALCRKRFGHVPNARFLEADATNLPYAGRCYGLIVSTWLLDHVKEPARLVNSVRSLLEPGGHAVFLFYGEPNRFICPWFVPWSRWCVLAEPVREEEIAGFKGVISRRSYSLGLSAMVDIEAPGA